MGAAYFFGDMSGWQLAALILSAILIGINKTGVPGIGTLPVIILALSFDARLSTGLQLVMLCTADLMAVAYYRQYADWKLVLRLLPWALGGIGMGAVALEYLDDSWMRPVIGGIILLMVAIHFSQQYLLRNDDRVPRHWAFTAFFGLMAGFTTQMANAGGPVMAIYLLAMRLPKNNYIGCCAWYFLILNYLKLPIFVLQERITWASFRADLAMLPVVLLGAWCGVWILKKIPQRGFEWIIQILAVIGALVVIFKDQLLP